MQALLNPSRIYPGRLFPTYPRRAGAALPPASLRARARKVEI